jgi:hypothetical protein
LNISFHFIFPYFIVYFVPNFRTSEFPERHQSILIGRICCTRETCRVWISLSLMFIYFVFNTPLYKPFHIFPRLQLSLLLPLILHLSLFFHFLLFLLFIHLLKYSCNGIGCIDLRGEFLRSNKRQTILNIVKIAELPFFLLLWILNTDDICSSERLFRNQVMPILRFLVQLQHCLITVYIACCSDTNDMRGFSKYLIADRILILIHCIRILRTSPMHLDQITCLEWQPSYRVALVLLDERHYIQNIENVSFGGADRVFEWG